MKAPDPIFILAPMDDVTDSVFRRIVAECSPPDLFFTEFVNVDGLMSPGRPELLKKLLFTEKEDKLVAQLWGKQPENFYSVARQIASGQIAAEFNMSDKNFIGIDLNMGCPDKTVVKNGACSALINNRGLAKDIIDATKQGAEGKLPVSVKTRLGFNDIDLGWLKFLLEQSIDMLTVHLRTRKEMSKVPAHLEVLSQIVDLKNETSPNTKLIANGDIPNRLAGEAIIKHYQVDGVMIGRGIFADPFGFSNDSAWLSLGPKDKIDLFKKHVRLFIETWGETGRSFQPLKKFCKLYVNHFDGASELREKLVSSKSVAELQTLLDAA